MIGAGHDWPSVQRSHWCWAWLAFCAEKLLVLGMTGLLCREVIGAGHDWPSVQWSHWFWAWLAFCAEKLLVLGMTGLLCREVIGAEHDWPSMLRWFVLDMTRPSVQRRSVLGVTGLLCRESIGAGHDWSSVQRIQLLIATAHQNYSHGMWWSWWRSVVVEVHWGQQVPVLCESTVQCLLEHIN